MGKDTKLSRLWSRIRKRRGKRRCPNLNGVLPSGETLLTASILDNELETLRFLLESGADVEATSDKGSPLMRAVSLSSHDAVEILLEAGATPDKIDKQGMTPLQAACTYGNVTAVKLLLRYGANPNEWEGYVAKETDVPLTLALEHEDQEVSRQIVQLLLDHGANVNAVNHYVNTPFLLACKQGNLDVVSLLLDSGGDVCKTSYCGFYPLELAMTYGHCGVVELILGRMSEQGHPIQRECVLGAIYGNCTHCLQLCLDAGVDIRSSIPKRGNISPLQMALKPTLGSYLQGHTCTYAEVDYSGPLTGTRIAVTRKLVEHGAYLTDIWQHDIFYDHPNDESPYLLAISAYGLRQNDKEKLWYEFRRMTFYGLEKSARLFCIAGYTPTSEDCDIAIKRLNNFRDKRDNQVLQNCLETICATHCNARSLVNCCVLVIRENMRDNVLCSVKQLQIPMRIKGLITLENEML